MERPWSQWGFLVALQLLKPDLTLLAVPCCYFSSFIFRPAASFPDADRCKLTMSMPAAAWMLRWLSCVQAWADLYLVSLWDKAGEFGSQLTTQGLHHIAALHAPEGIFPCYALFLCSPLSWSSSQGTKNFLRCQCLPDQSHTLHKVVM